MEGEAGVDQACADKGEEEYKRAQEAKQAQDQYITRLTEELEYLENKCSQYESQANAMDDAAAETIDNVRKAEEETERMRMEEKRGSTFSTTGKVFPER